ncbi:hypothetical protein MIR68_003432 [Amoeboaphelidium protococcarum]|nr:hypothetical protein MIR68_003432 [Amoeboaphelidium protococcarum]
MFKSCFSWLFRPSIEKQTEKAIRLKQQRLKASKTYTDDSKWNSQYQREKQKINNDVMRRKSDDEYSEDTSDDQSGGYDDRDLSLSTVKVSSVSGSRQSPYQEIKANSRQARSDDYEMPDFIYSADVKQIGEDNLLLEGTDGDIGPQIVDPRVEVKAKQQILAERLRTLEEEQGRQVYQIAFYGLNNSGKSTFVKILKLFYSQDGITDEERNYYLNTITINLISSLRELIQGMEKFNLSLDAGRDYSNLLEALDDSLDSNGISPAFYTMNKNSGSGDTSPLVRDILALQNDQGFRQVLQYRDALKVTPSFDYFISNVTRILSADYIPTDEDVLMCRSSTMSIGRERIVVDQERIVRCLDFGGYDFQRAKWPMHFTPKQAISIYVHSLPSYCDTTGDSHSVVQTMLQQSYNSFYEVANHRDLKDVPLVLLLNKKDLLVKTMETHPLSEYCGDYPAQDNGNVKAAIDYFSSKFTQLNHYPDRPFHIYITNALDIPQAKALLKKVVILALELYEQRL